MAKKGQIFNKYSYKLKMDIVTKYLNGEGGYTFLANEYNVPINTIKTWVFQYKHKNNDFKTLKRGRKKEENIDYKERYEILKEFQNFLKAQREKK